MTDSALMPPRSPLAMPVQALDRPFSDAAAPGAPIAARDTLRWRVLAFGPALLGTAALLWVMWGWFSAEGTSALEAGLTALICFNFFWICLSLSTALSGLVSMMGQGRPARLARPAPVSVALLVPIYNEVPWYVLGNACAMLEELRDGGGGHDYTLYVLSDTRDPAIAAQERASIAALRATVSPGLRIHYRRRAQNTDRKVGNIADWVRGWGGAHEAMLVLDADSLMTGRAIARLTDALARDPGAGLIQSFPQLIGAQSVFARAQQFANAIYGAALAEGLANWVGHEGNYWGHNAILRTRAFAASAGLPRLARRGGGSDLIMSHDFVEAGLMRRAGWGVRFLPRIRGSYEETPATLIDHVQRDRRWCQGNLQHLGLLRSRGFHAVSRFHLFHGAMGYLLSPLWFLLLLVWALIGNGREASVLTYFSDANPLMPTWPEMTETRHVLVLVLMYAVLLAPKLLGALAVPFSGLRYRDLGGPWRFAFSLLTEILLSVAYAPILMVQQMIAVLRALMGLQQGWDAQAREGGSYRLGTLARAHFVETISGLALLAGLVSGLVTLWLLPIAISLAAAIPLSAVSGLSLARLGLATMGTAEVFREPSVVQAARHYRAVLRRHLDADTGIAPAE
ncbi:MAG: glucans biosynthesis glucosyltransferase MdoH [Rhodobacteraceae bacterium]|nr:glucans biosynthesis glucosyltransferase MdoH [Paracoccaceae bacterium]